MSAKVLLIDNFDSFTFNLYQYLGELADEVTVVRNTDVPFSDIKAGKFTHIVISPGPGDPTDEEYFHGARPQPSRSSTANTPFWASVWATRASARRSAARSLRRPPSCTAKPAPSSTTARAYCTAYRKISP